ncbi:hypothetical protein LO762_25195 [Actinocorallia sp. API 0066]|uniref:hypothetical protein n=1 Tax=Actinocorallia sp. API 0066 TaxID=2896846 RepID=UPI001E2B0C77|nr:hypothetical protein [Actinocorallia sp. API 0066]MCD0452457.1 hypothetical protein [Actinocorallia sp. API 0066]
MSRIHRVSVATDIKGFGKAGPDGHLRVQRLLFEAIDTALGATLGDRAAECGRQPQGDAELTVLPPGIDEGAVLRVLLNELTAALRRANAPLRDEHRVRVRIGVDAGAVGTGPGGFTGNSPVNACRLRDSDAARKALDDSDEPYVVIVAAQFYSDVLGPAFEGDPSWSFRSVAVTLKEFRGWGWLSLPSGSSGEPEPPRKRPPGGDVQKPGGLL